MGLYSKSPQGNEKKVKRPTNSRLAMEWIYYSLPQKKLETKVLDILLPNNKKIDLNRPSPISIPKPGGYLFIPQYEKDKNHYELENLRNKLSRPYLKTKVVPEHNYTTITPKITTRKPYFLRAYSNRLKEIGSNKIIEWLKKLGVKADGIWGDNTEKAYQRYLNLKNTPVINLPIAMISPAELMGIYTEETKPLYQKIGLVLKQGGSLLPSRNPVKRFKLRKKL